ncbi:MAG TPA: hypothetical protein VMZ53_28445 [Kofleriaceae bacterium]|nr:hypothetical protein [Kofleriaceae bacterium]
MLRRSVFSVGLLVLASVDAYANPADIVPGGQDPEDPNSDHAQKSVDIYGQVDYAYELDSSSLIRERLGPGSDPNAAVPTVHDLKFHQFKHTITPSVHVGIFRDTFFYAALPIVITQVRELELDDGVDRAGSPTVTDGLLPMQGFDARDPTTPAAGNLMFRGPSRKGLDQVHLGLGIAPMNQAHDPTKPIWKLGAEIRLAVGKIMKFDPMAPNANTGVSQGVQELKVWTSFARKLGWAEPWVDLWWMVPLAAKSDALFQDPGFGASNIQKSQQAGLGFGLELYALDQGRDQTRISLDFGTRATVHFEGREYTEMWEAFAYAGDSRGTGPLILDSDPTRADVQPLSYPGISNVENYLETHGLFAVRAQLGPHVRFSVSGDLTWKTDHLITFADAGKDSPDDDNDLVNPGTDEVNPLHVPGLDLVGHRYRSYEGFDVAFGVTGQVLF